MMNGARLISVLFLALIATGAAVGAALAAPTGLNVIPTADILAEREVVVGYQLDGVRLSDTDCNHWALLQIGLTDRFEVGVDRCFCGEVGTFGNAKLLLFREAEHHPALAVGVLGLSEGASGEPYAVASADAGGGRARLPLRPAARR